MQSQPKSGCYLIDLAGHEAYLRTTLRGLTNYFPSYVLLVVSLNRGVTTMTREHLAICRNLNIPIIVVFSKVDIAPPEKIKETTEEVKKILQTCGIRFQLKLEVPADDTLKSRDPGKSQNKFLRRMIEAFIKNPSAISPTIQISNKTGFNIELLRNFLLNLPPMWNLDFLSSPMPIPTPMLNNGTGGNSGNNSQSRLDLNAVNGGFNNIEEFARRNDLTQVFLVYKPYLKPGIGLIIHGKCLIGTIKRNDKILLGPLNGTYVEVRVRSIHSEPREEIPVLSAGESGCLAIRVVDPRIVVDRHQLNNGRVCINKPILVRQIRADIIVCSPRVTIVRDYAPYMHCGNVSVPVYFVEALKTSGFNAAREVNPTPSSESVTGVVAGSGEDTTGFPLRFKDRASVVLQFPSGQFVYPGGRMILREGNVRAIGTIREVTDTEFLPYTQPKCRRSFQERCNPIGQLVENSKVESQHPSGSVGPLGSGSPSKSRPEVKSEVKVPAKLEPKLDPKLERTVDIPAQESKSQVNPQSKSDSTEDSLEEIFKFAMST